MRNILYTVILLLYSCESAQIKVPNLWIEPQNIECVKRLGVSPRSIFYDEVDKTILTEQSDGDYFVKRINIESGEIQNLVRVGRGRDEYLQLYINDIDKEGNFYGRDIKSLVSFSRDGKLSSRLETDYKVFDLFTINRLGDLYVGYGNFNHPKNILTICDSLWQEIGYFGEFPNDGISDAECGEFGKIMAYQGYILSNETQSKVAYISGAGELFDIYSLADYHDPKIINRVQNNLPKYKYDGPGISVVHLTRTFYHVGAYSTDNKIYILYSGKSMKSVSNLEYFKARLSNKILVYDWNGNHLYNLNTDINLANICVSNDDNEIIAVYLDDNYEIRLCRFDISNIEAM